MEKVISIDDHDRDAIIIYARNDGAGEYFTAVLREGSPVGAGKTQRGAVEDLAVKLRIVAEHVATAARRL
jgi:hypothetical protein